MAKFRRILLWLTLIGAVSLAQLAVLSAFLGEETAWELFNSPPLMLAWIALTVLLVAGFAAFGQLARRPGLLAIHLGCILILAGGMWGSKAGMKLMDSWSDHKRVYKGYTTLYDGESTRDVVDKNHEQFDELPFTVKCKKFHMEYYPYERKLDVVVTHMVKTGRWRDGKEKMAPENDDKRFRWKLNEWRDLPLCDDIRIRVTDFEPHIPPVTEPFLLVMLRRRHGGYNIREVKSPRDQWFTILSGHAGSLLGRIRQTYKTRWEPVPDAPGQIMEVKSDGPGSSPVAEVDVAVHMGTQRIFTSKFAKELSRQDDVFPQIRYVPQSRTREETGREQSGPVIVVSSPGMEKQIVPAKAGQQFTYRPGPRGQLFCIVRETCRVRMGDAPPAPGSDPNAPRHRVVIEAEGPDTEPCVHLDLLAFRETMKAYTPGTAARVKGLNEGELLLRYIPPDDSSKMKGMQRPRITFEVKRGSRKGNGTFVVRKAQKADNVPLDMLYSDHEAWLEAGAPRVSLPTVKRSDDPPHKEYLADLVIIENDKEVAKKTVELNDPLYYGGYRFYQTSWDQKDLAYTVITVKSDAGWPAVLAGMILLMAGTFIHFWFEPIWKAVRKRRKERQAVPQGAARKAGT